MKMEFPIKHVEGNLVFGYDKTVWAYFQVHGFSYDFLDDDEKKQPFFKQKNFLKDIASDLHFLVLPNPTDVNGILNETISEMQEKDYPLQQNGLSFMTQVKEALQKDRLANETSEYMHYIGVQLNRDHSTFTSSNKGIGLIQRLREVLKGMNTAVYQAVGLKPNDILENDIQWYQSQSARIQSMLEQAFSCKIRTLMTPDVIHIIEKSYSTTINNSDIPMRDDFSSGNDVVGKDEEGVEYRAVRTNEKDFFDVQDTNIQEVDAKTLRLSKVLKNEDNHDEFSNLYVRYLTVSDMGDVHAHPGFEWIYEIQSQIPFPVFVSMRANYVPNEYTMRKLSNVQLETKDQRENALQGEQNVDENIDKIEQGARSLKSHFQESGDPSFSCKIVFKVTAESKEQLDSRVDTLQQEMARFQMEIVPPFGEQIQLLLSTIPSFHLMNRDYMMQITPSVISGMMFGATNNIGDNRGFYIGHTKFFSKPVFVKPDLAAKAFRGLGNTFDSLAVLVAGQTGKGKSFWMNLFTYLSVLSGSSALIIDPKGDRKGWKDGLPYIDKNFIEVWEMGSDEEDAGSLDPFRTSSSMSEAKEITMDVLAYLTNTDISDEKYSLLSDGVEKASKTKEPCIGEVLNYLDELYKKGVKDMRSNNKEQTMTDRRIQILESLTESLKALERNSLSVLLFGQPGQNYRSLEHNKPLQVLMIQHLNLPDEKQQERPQVSHKISEAIMISITAWTKQYMFKGDRSKHKIILQDEASSIENNPMGAQLMDWIVRMGRHYNTTLLEGSQNASDHGDNVAHMGMKFSFGLRKKDEAEQMLGYLNLPVTDSNVQMLMNLSKGETLFQDIYAGTSVVVINPIFRDLYNAFDTSTATEEEREKEEEQQA